MYCFYDQLTFSYEHGILYDIMYSVNLLLYCKNRLIERELNGYTLTGIEFTCIEVLTTDLLFNIYYDFAVIRTKIVTISFKLDYPKQNSMYIQ